MINCYCDNCLKYFSKEKKIQHTEQECLKNQLLNYQKEFNQTLKSLVQQIRFTLNEINNKDQNKNNICQKCRQFACESQLDLCHQCFYKFCSGSCAKDKLAPCTQCRANICYDCLQFSKSKNKCIKCEPLITSISSSTLLCNRTSYNMPKFTFCEVKPK